MAEITDYNKSRTEIWIVDFHFYYLIPEKVIVPKGTDGAKLDKFDNWYINRQIEKVVPDMFCKKIPMKYIIKDRYTYNRAVSGLKESEFIIDPETGLLKFKIIYKRFSGLVN